MSMITLPSRMSAHCASFTPFLVDVAVNLTDCVYRGVDWRERRIHEDDLDHVLQRAAASNVRKVIITGTSLSQSIDAIRLCRHYRELYKKQQQEEEEELEEKEIQENNVKVNEEAHHVPTRSSQFRKHNLSSTTHDVNETQTVNSSNSIGSEIPNNDLDSKSYLPANMLYCTVGVHPAHCAEFTRPLHTDREVVHADAHKGNYSLVKPILCTMEDVQNNTVNITKRLEILKELIVANRDVVIAIGEIGLDDAELEYCPRDVQEFFFREQLRAFAPLHLPFMFHSRECGMRLVNILQEEEEWKESMHCVQSIHEVQNIEKSNYWHGIVHSFNGSMEEQEALLSMGLYLSINGSAFRDKIKAEQLIRIPTDRLLLESDGPWCDIRSHDYGSAFVHTTFPTCKRNKFTTGKCVERRNEPCHVVQVLEEYIGAVRAAQADSHTDAIPKSKCSYANESNVIDGSYLSADEAQMHNNEDDSSHNKKMDSDAEYMSIGAILRNQKISLAEAKKAMTRILYENF